MKKFLALLLALVMTMSLVTIGASAKTAFTDDKDISADCVEAVEVLSAMGIIDGYADGSFKPQAVLNRAAGAKFVAYLMLGEKKADGLVATGTLFEDVAADYALAPYVEWCAKMGIVDGYGNGKFGPKNALTQAAFGKMLLTALGYDSAKEAYTGAGWQKTVYADGVAAGVYGDDGEVFAACDRETAAKMALGALTADMVCYGKTVKVFGVEKFVYETLEKVNNGKYNGTFVLPVALSENGAVATGEKLWENYKDLEYAEVMDIFARPGHVWSYGKNFEKFYMDAPVLEYTKEVDSCDILVDLGIAKTSNKDVEIEYTALNGVVDDDDFDLDHKGCGEWKDIGGQGTLTQVFELDDDVYAVVEIETFLAKVESTRAAKHAKHNDEAKLEVYFDAYVEVDVLTDTLKKDDYILVNFCLDDDDKYVADEDLEVNYGEADYMRVVGVADSKEGKLTGASNTETRVDKVAYKDAANFFLGYDDAKAASNNGDKFTFFFDQYGNVIGCADVEVTEKYTVIDKAWKDNVKGTDTAFADLVGFDAKVLAEEVEVADNKVDAVNVREYKNQNDALYDDIFTYDVNDDDEYEFDRVAEAAVATTEFNNRRNVAMGYNVDQAAINVDVWTRNYGRWTKDTTVIEMNKDTVVLCKDLNGDYKVYNGVDLPEVTFGTVAFVQDEDADYAELVYLTDVVYGDDAVTGFVFANFFDWDEGFENVTVWVGDKKVVVKVDSEDFENFVTEDGFYKFENVVDKDGNVVVKVTDKLDANDDFFNDAVAKVGGEVVTLANYGGVKNTDKIAMYLVDFDEEEVTAVDYEDVVDLFEDLEKDPAEDIDEVLYAMYFTKDDAVDGAITEIYFFVADAE